ncbi:MAG: translation initiation factor IF-1 [Candidatus Comchoanobacterales bacterium]
MSNSEVIELEGSVKEVLPNGVFLVEATIGEQKQHLVTCHLSGKIRKFRIRILQNDKVKVEVTPYDLTKGRITKRL